MAKKGNILSVNEYWSDNWTLRECLASNLRIFALSDIGCRACLDSDATSTLIFSKTPFVFLSCTNNVLAHNEKRSL